MSRAKTPEEIREDFLTTVRSLSRYWASLPNKTPQERCDGLAFSIMNIFDGTNASLPAFDIVAHPHEDDTQYAIENRENYILGGTIINDCMLHDLYYQ